MQPPPYESPPPYPYSDNTLITIRKEIADVQENISHIMVEMMKIKNQPVSVQTQETIRNIMLIFERQFHLLEDKLTEQIGHFVTWATELPRFEKESGEHSILLESHSQQILELTRLLEEQIEKINHVESHDMKRLLKEHIEMKLELEQLKQKESSIIESLYLSRLDSLFYALCRNPRFEHIPYVDELLDKILYGTFGFDVEEDLPRGQISNTKHMCIDILAHNQSLSLAFWEKLFTTHKKYFLYGSLSSFFVNQHAIDYLMVHAKDVLSSYCEQEPMFTDIASNPRYEELRDSLAEICQYTGPDPNQRSLKNIGRLKKVVFIPFLEIIEKTSYKEKLIKSILIYEQNIGLVRKVLDLENQPLLSTVFGKNRNRAIIPLLLEACKYYKDDLYSPFWSYLAANPLFYEMMEELERKNDPIMETFSIVKGSNTGLSSNPRALPDLLRDTSSIKWIQFASNPHPTAMQMVEPFVKKVISLF
jgi:hypothetical protein